MALQFLVTAVNRAGSTAFTATCQLQDTATTPPTVIEVRSIGLVYVADDAVNPATGATFTQAERVAAAKQSLVDQLKAWAGQARAARADFTAISAALSGLTFP